MTTQLSPHFSLEEMLESDIATRLGISNAPADDEVLENLYALAAGLERVRSALGDAPILISSGYRSPRLNKAVGGSGSKPGTKPSAHTRGLAADFRAPAFGSPREIALALAAANELVGADQIIFEGSWTHVGFPEIGSRPRGEVLTAHFAGGGVTYTKGV